MSESASTKPRSGLRARTIVLVLVCATLPVALVTAFYVYAFQSFAQGEFEGKAKLITEQLAESSAEGMLIEDEPLLDGRVRAGLDLDDVVFVALYDVEGLPMAHAQKREIEVGEIMCEGPALREMNSGGERLLDVRQRVLRTGLEQRDGRVGPLGCARVLVSAARIEDTIETTVINILLIALVAIIGLCVGGASFVGYRLSKPIMDLVAWVHRFSSEDREHSEASTGAQAVLHGHATREVEILAQSFDAMSTRVRQSIHDLAASEEHLRSTLDAISDAVIATDAQGRVSWLNPVAESLLGVHRRDVSGVAMDELLRLVDPETRAAGPVPVGKLLTGEGEVDAVIHRLLVSGIGQSVPRRVALSGSPIRGREGRIMGVVLIVRDVTEDYAMQEQLAQRRKLDAVGLLAGGVAHDFNNMLAGILGGAELLEDILLRDDGEALKRSEDIADTREFLDTIIEAATRSAELTGQLLSLSRKNSLETHKLDLHQTVEEAVALLRRTVDKRVTITVALRASRSTVDGDAAQLQSMFINLGVNASHAMDEGGELDFETRVRQLDEGAPELESFPNARPGTFVEVCVRDSGCGISPQNLARIFEPFFTTKGEGEGTGLGLAAVHGTTQQHGGVVTVRSELDVGTTFCVLLPLAEGRAESTSEELSIVRGTGHVLVIDDEALARSIARAMLEGLGYRVSTAVDGKNGLQAYAASRGDIDLVVLDILMPVMNGVACFSALEALDPEVKVVVVSGFARGENIELLRRGGALAVLTKPYRRAELSRVVAEAIALGQPRIVDS